MLQCGCRAPSLACKGGLCSPTESKMKPSTKKFVLIAAAILIVVAAVNLLKGA
nr:MAG TPA: hypothetical protein [Caudoviricetes sp.]